MGILRGLRTTNAGFLVLLIMLAVCGCWAGSENHEQVKVWSQRGLGDGRFHKPRAIAADSENFLYIVDMTGRVQIFDHEQNFVRAFRTPAVKMGKPCGLTISNDQKLMVADTHYYRVLFYDRNGNQLEDRTIGGQQGMGPGEFSFVTDVIQDSKGNYYVSEYGDFDRIQKFTPDGQFILQWGGRGSEDGQFLRPQGLAIDEQDRVWVADSSNHRIQVFDASGSNARHVLTWGIEGRGTGQLRFPYDLVLNDGFVYVCEFGNHRIQKFDREGNSFGSWGMPGRDVGQMHQPWAMTIDGHNLMHILDSYNHRVQTINCDEINWSVESARDAEDDD